jgi:hypothetical protein
LTHHHGQVFYVCREGYQFFDLFKGGFGFGIEGRNIRSESLDVIHGLIMGGVQGKDATIKFLVVVVSHLGYKWKRVGLVGLHRKEL